MSRRSPRRFEAILRAEGMPPELPAQPSWRNASEWIFQKQRSSGGNFGSTGRVRVILPSDRENHQQTVTDRAEHFLSDAEHVPGYNARLEDLYWRGDWRCYPKWHRQLVWEHVECGMTVAEFSRAHRLTYAQAWRALEQHKRRAGIGAEEHMGGGGLNGGIEKQQQHVSRVEQTSAVRVRVVFNEKLPPTLGLGHISYAEGELVMGGRFVRIDFPADKPNPVMDHVLIPVGPGISLAVYKE